MRSHLCLVLTVSILVSSTSHFAVPARRFWEDIGYT